MDIEARRAKKREQYAASYPPGFPRRRNAKQVEKQLIAQYRYEHSPAVAQVRKLQKMARVLLHGPNARAEKLVGCTHEQLIAHLNFKGPFFLAYHKHPREFNLANVDERHAAFHYTNLYARPKSIRAYSHRAKSYQCPSQQAPLPAALSREAPSAQASSAPVRVSYTPREMSPFW